MECGLHGTTLEDVCRPAVMVLDSGILVAVTAQQPSLSEELRVYDMVRPSAWPHEKQMHNNRSSVTSVFH